MSKSIHELHIDVAVNLNEVRAVFSIGSLALEGDLPASIFHTKLILSRVTSSPPD
jgi:hypothetical protein